MSGYIGQMLFDWYLGLSLMLFFHTQQFISTPVQENVYLKDLLRKLLEYRYFCGDL